MGCLGSVMNMCVCVHTCTHTNTRIQREEVQTSEVPFRISWKQMERKKKKHDFLFISSLGRKDTKVKREGDGSYDVKASVFKTFMHDWDYPYSRHTNVLDRINVYLSKAICCSDISLFLFLLNTLSSN